MCILVLNFLYFLLNLWYSALFLLNFLLIFDLIQVVILDYLQLFEPFRKYFVLIQIGVHLFSDLGVVFLQLLQLFDHFAVNILLNSREEALLALCCHVQLLSVNCRFVFLFVCPMEQCWIVTFLLCCDKKRALRIVNYRCLVFWCLIDALHLFWKIVQAQEWICYES